MTQRLGASLAAIFLISLTTITSAQNPENLRLLYRSTNDPAIAGISFSFVGNIGGRIFASQQYFAIGNVLVEFQLDTQSQKLKVIDTLIVPATTVALSKNKVYIAPHGYLVDISQPGSMRRIGRVPSRHLDDGGYNRKMAVWVNDTLLTGVTDGGHKGDRGGFEMFAVVESQSPRLLDFWNISTWRNDNVMVRDTLAFLNIGTTLYIASLANGKNIRQVSSILLPNSGGDVLAMLGNYVYLLDIKYGTNNAVSQLFLTSVNVSDPTYPKIINSLPISFRPYQLLAYHGYLFASGLDQNMHVFSLADPAKPELIFQYVFPNQIYGFTIDEKGLLITTNGDSGISIWELPFTTTVEDDRAGNQPVPKRFELNPIYPNPGTNQIQISYHLVEPAHVRLVIYNMLGEKIKELVDNLQSARLYSMTWDGKTDKNTRAAAGIYFAELSVNGQSVRRKFSLIR